MNIFPLSTLSLDRGKAFCRNDRGYDIAKRWRAKFSHISPVWFQLRAAAGGGFAVHGQHDVDREWIQALRVVPHQVGTYAPALFSVEQSKINPDNPSVSQQCATAPRVGACAQLHSLL